jgi:hypothetical protein
MSMMINSARFGGASNPVGSYVFTKASSHYMQLATAVVTGPPATLMVWLDADGAAQDSALLAVGNSAASSRIQLSIESDLDASATSFNTTPTAQSSQRGNINSSQWEHIAGVFASSTSRTVYLNGVAGTANTSSSVVAGFNNTILGARYTGGTRGAYLEGKLSHVAIWNIVLSGAEIATLAAGANPQSVQLANLVFYVPLNQSGATTDIISSNALTVSGPTFSTNGPTVAAYP